MAGDSRLSVMVADRKFHNAGIHTQRRNLVFSAAGCHDGEPPHDPVFLQPGAGGLCPGKAVLDTLVDACVFRATRHIAIMEKRIFLSVAVRPALGRLRHILIFYLGIIAQLPGPSSGCAAYRVCLARACPCCYMERKVWCFL